MNRVVSNIVNRRTKVLVLLSGGVDSTACVNYYLDQRFDVRGLFIDYGQLANKRELNSATRVASHYGIELITASFSSPRYFSIGEIVGRNAFLVIAALLVEPKLSGIVSLGIHSGVPYYDCSESFVKDIAGLLDGYTDGKVKLDAPFLKWDKAMIYAYCKEKNVPINLTYSCEAGTSPPCGKCLSCQDRNTLNVS